MKAQTLVPPLEDCRFQRLCFSF